MTKLTVCSLLSVLIAWRTTAFPNTVNKHSTLKKTAMRTPITGLSVSRWLDSSSNTLLMFPDSMIVEAPSMFVITGVRKFNRAWLEDLNRKFNRVLLMQLQKSWKCSIHCKVTFLYYTLWRKTDMKKKPLNFNKMQ